VSNCSWNLKSTVLKYQNGRGQKSGECALHLE